MECFRGYSRFGKWLILVCTLCSCSAVHQVQYTRLDGTICQVTKVNPVWYSSETMIDCMVDGKSQQVPSNHEDLGMVAGFTGLIGAFLGASL